MLSFPPAAILDTWDDPTGMSSAVASNGCEIPKVFRLFFPLEAGKNSFRGILAHPRKTWMGRDERLPQPREAANIPRAGIYGNSSEKSGMCSQGGFFQSFPKVFLPCLLLATLPF